MVGAAKGYELVGGQFLNPLYIGGYYAVLFLHVATSTFRLVTLIPET